MLQVLLCQIGSTYYEAMFLTDQPVLKRLMLFSIVNNAVWLLLQEGWREDCTCVILFWQGFGDVLEGVI